MPPEAEANAGRGVGEPTTPVGLWGFVSDPGRSSCRRVFWMSYKADVRSRSKDQASFLLYF